MANKISLCCLFGGKSTEYEVSLMSVYSVLENLNAEKYDLTLLGVTKDGSFYLYDGDYDKIRDGTWNTDAAHLFPAGFLPDGNGTLLILRADSYEKRRIDAAFPVMHGANCEDGRLQGLLEICGIPCVGSGCTASAVSMDKDFTKRVLSGCDIPMAPWVTLTRKEILADPEAAAERLAPLGGFPLFVKPANAGSSVGVSKAKNRDGLLQALNEAARYDEKVLVEQCIVGKEVEVAVFDDGQELFAAMPGEIEPGAEFYDYHDKYIGGKSRAHLPARILPETAAAIRETAKTIFAALGCRGLSRVDFFVTKEDDGREKIVFNEINTLPGFTKISMYPKMMIASGYTYSSLIDALIASALIKR